MQRNSRRWWVVIAALAWSVAGCPQKSADPEPKTATQNGTVVIVGGTNQPPR